MSKKYKYLTKIQDLRLIPSRVLKFKKSKWTKLKSILTKRFQTVTADKKRTFLKTAPRFPLGFRSNLSLSTAFVDFTDSSNNLKFKTKSKLKIFDKFKVSVNKGRFSYLSSLSKDKIQSHLKLKYLLNQKNIVTRQECKDRDLYIKSIIMINLVLEVLHLLFIFLIVLLKLKIKLKQELFSLMAKNFQAIQILKRVML